MLGKSSVHFSSMLSIVIVILVVKVDSQRIPRKSPPALPSKLRQGQQNAASGLVPRGAWPPPIGMLGPPINMFTLLKTATFVFNFKLWPP